MKSSTSSPSTSPDDPCANCGRGGVRLRRVTRSFGRGPQLLIIEDIPMWSCPHCGESYFTAQTMHEIEHIRMQRTSRAIERPVPVATFIGEAA